MTKDQINIRVDVIDEEIKSLRSNSEHEESIIDFLIDELKWERKEILEQWYILDND